MDAQVALVSWLDVREEVPHNDLCRIRVAELHQQ